MNEKVVAFVKQEIIENGERLSTREIADSCGVSLATARKTLLAMEQAGDLDKVDFGTASNAFVGFGERRKGANDYRWERSQG